MKKILLVLIFSILFSSNAFSSDKFYVFGADIPGSKDSSLCAFDGDQKRYNKSTSTYVNNYGEYSNCNWTIGFTGSVKIQISYLNSQYGTTSTALYKGKATNFANNHKSSYPDFVLNKTNGVGNEKAPQTIYVFSEKSVVVAERERLKNTPKLAEIKSLSENQAHLLKIKKEREQEAEIKSLEEKKVATPIIKPKPEVITTNEETMVASAVEPQLARIGEAEFGFKCEWMHWNSKGSASYNACIDTYVNADKAEQEELRLAKVEAENQAQQAKLLEDKMNELDRMYGATCKAMGLSKKDDEFPKCMMEMMKIEQEKEQAKIQNEIAMAQIQLQQAQLEAQNKAIDLKLAELEKNNELIREANIRSQKAEAERNRQQQVLLKKQIALQEKKDKQQGWMNALMALNALQPKQPSVGFIQTMPTRTICSWQYGQYVCNTR